MMNTRITKCFIWIGLISLSSICTKSESCPDRAIYNWLGNTFWVSSWEECTSHWFDICMVSKCTPDQNIYDTAIGSSGWTKNSCFTYQSGSAGSDDMKCSIPHSDPVNEALFDPICKIHDLCLKTNGRNADACNDEFYYNMQQLCHMQYPDGETAVVLAGCLTVASAWDDAVSSPELGGAVHRGGIDPNQCVTSSSSCYSQGPCNDGYMDKTSGGWNWWACGVNCAGGQYYTDGGCGCACIPAGQCALTPNYHDFNIYRHIPQLSFIRVIGVSGEYLSILLIIFVVSAILIFCYKKRREISKQSIKYEPVSLDSSSDVENTPINQ